MKMETHQGSQSHTGQDLSDSRGTLTLLAQVTAGEEGLPSAAAAGSWHTNEGTTASLLTHTVASGLAGHLGPRDLAVSHNQEV